MAKKSKPLAEFITLTDDRGAQHSFRPLEIFCVGKKNFAVLQSLQSKNNEATIFRFTLGKDGMPKGFAEPTPAEFDQASARPRPRRRSRSAAEPLWRRHHASERSRSA